MHIKFMNWVGRSALVGLLLGMVACEPPPPPPAPEPTRLFPACQAAAALPAEPLPLKQALTGPLVPRQTAVYTVTMEIDQFLRVEVTEEAMDVHLYLCGPGGEGVDRDSDWVPEVPEELSAVAWAAGEYRLLVHGGPGRFQIRTKALRSATPRDRYRVEAERLTYTAMGLCLNKIWDERFLKTMRSAVPLWHYLKEEPREAEALYWLASGEDKPTGDAAEAYRLFERILPVWQAEGPAEREAETLRRLGLHLLDQGKPQEARERFDQAMAAWGRVPDVPTRKVGEAATHQVRGKLLYEQGELRAAQAAFEQALALRKQYAPDSVGTTLVSLASVWNILGQPHKALEYVDQAIREWDDTSAAAFNNRANVLGQMGAFVEAKEDLDQALKMVRNEGNRPFEAVTLNNLAWVREMLDEYDEARKEYREALNISRELGDRDLEATILTSLGRVATDLEEWEEASRLLQEALPLRSGNLRGEAITRHDLAKVQIRLGDLQEAEKNLKRSLKLARDTGDRLTEARAYSRQGLLAGARGQFEDGLALSGEALAIIESERDLLPRQDFQAHQTAIRLRFYEHHLGLLFDAARQNSRSDHWARAFALSEQVRARNLVELIRESGADLDQELDSALRHKEGEARQRLAAADYRRATLQTRRANPGLVRGEEKKIAALVTELRQIREEIRRANPAYAEQVRPAPLAVSTVQTALLDPGDVLLEYFLGVERSFVWAVTPTTLTMMELPPRRQIESLVEAYRKALHTNIVEERELAAQLSELLLAPVPSALDGERWVVVPEGALHQIPFAALPIPDGAAAERSRRLVVDRFEVVTAPSGTLIAALRRRDAAGATAPEKVVTFADAVYSWDDSRMLGIGEDTTRGPTRWQPLRYSVQEAAALRAWVPPPHRVEALGFDASKSAFLQLSPGEFQIVHLAAHGEMHPQRPELARLVFSQFSRTGEPLDGDLRFAEIYDLSLRADLVVLSACETALGEQVRGEGVIGFTRGFLHAGARRVVSSLWKVEDSATAELMKRFYRYHLGEGLPAATALRRAQLSMKGERAWENPEHWAGFVLQGEWR
jgi:CHAT domain-containing protein/Tfp pilus assembly protein PilF